MEELLYLLGILLHPENKDMSFPLILTGPSDSEPYFKQVVEFISLTLGSAALERIDVIIDNAELVAKKMKVGMKGVEAYRRKTDDAFFYNWGFTIEESFQQPFIASHDNMANLTAFKRSCQCINWPPIYVEFFPELSVEMLRPMAFKLLPSMVLSNCKAIPTS